MENIEVKFVVACLICGIHRGFSIYPDCKREAEKWGIELFGDFEEQDHIWTEQRLLKP